MPGLLLEMESQAAGETPKAPEYGFVVSHQRVDLEIDFPTQTLKGRTELVILPQTRNLDVIHLDAKQCTIAQGGIKVNGRIVDKHTYEDGMASLDVPTYIERGVEQYEQHRERIRVLETERCALQFVTPKGLWIEEVDPLSDAAAAAVTARAVGAPAARHSSVAIETGNTPMMTPRPGADQSSVYQPLTVSIEFTVNKFRDGLHFAGLLEGDRQYPHVYTKHSIDAGLASCIFPCIDDSTMRCTWEFHITCSRTLGDAMKKKQPTSDKVNKNSLSNGSLSLKLVEEEDENSLSEEEKLLEMTVVCSGEQTQEADHPKDSSKKIVSFVCGNIVAAQHIGFAIGPFEQVDLTEYREEEDGDKLGQGQSLPVYAYCLPGRSQEVRHVCLPMVHAVDWFTLTFGSYPFSDFSFVFVDGQVRDIEHTATLAICSDRLLFPPDIINPEMEVTRTLVHAIASQWVGVSIIANEKTDRWLTIGLSHFMTGRFMQSLCGNNDYMFRQKQLSDKLVAQDVDRPSIHSLGELLHLGKFEMDFMTLKAPLVLFILDKRLYKATSTVGSIVRVLSKLITQANIGTSVDSVLSTEGFRRLVEKVSKWRQTEPFWNQWVLGAGCPKFSISHRFNKKRLCVEVAIAQKQESTPPGKKLEHKSFLREVREDVHGVYAGELQPVFTGSMTIRIHEANGTPYEHVIEITKAYDMFSIPYNTKYKRLKRNNRARERLNAGLGDINGEINEDTVYFMLGDILMSEEEKAEWKTHDWSTETKEKMDDESFEWYRVDADFEWLCHKDIKMPPYMWTSQLQQDRDVVAHYEAMQFLHEREAHTLPASFSIRTLMDSRYFHGIRTMAVASLAKHATDSVKYTGMHQLEKAFMEFFCYPGQMINRPNDFSDRRSYNVELAIPQAMATIRDPKGRCPKAARGFIYDQLQLNDNTDNEYSDVFKIANLLDALATSLIPGQGQVTVLAKDREAEEADDPEPGLFRARAIEELDRHRRMDEWINSYQNIFTTTVLDAKKRLMMANVIPKDRTEFLRYLVDGNLEQVRITAFTALVELGFLTDDAILKFLLCCLSSDPSPYVRSHLFEVFVLGLAHQALDVEVEDTKEVEDPAQKQADNGELIVEHNFEIDTQVKQILANRTTTIEGALAALKDELQDNDVLRTALWDAIKSDATTLSEQINILDICSILYDPVDEMVIKLPLPRFWKVKHLGKGKLKFSKTDRIRTRPMRPRMKVKPIVVSLPPAIPAPSVRPPAPPLKLSFSGSNAGLVSRSTSSPVNVAPAKPISAAPKPLKLVLTSNPARATPPPIQQPPSAVPPPQPRPAAPVGAMNPPPKRPLESGEANKRPRKIVKLFVSGSRVEAILNSTPRPTHPLPKKKSSASPAPKTSSGPRQSPSPSAHKQINSSPAPQISVAPSISPVVPTISPSPTSSTSTGLNGTGKPRQRLPDAAPTSKLVPPPPSKPTMKLKLTTKPRQPLPGAPTAPPNPPPSQN